MGRPGIGLRSNVIALFVVIPVATVLIYFFGIAGAASSWVVYHLFVYAYMLPRICKQCLHLSIWSWYLHVLKILALTAATYRSAWVPILRPHSDSLLASIRACAR